MRNTVSGLWFALLAATVLTASFPSLARAEEVGCGPEEVKNTSILITQLKTSILADAAAGRIDQALAQLKELDKYKPTPDIAEARLAVAEAARAKGRSREAADLLKITAAEDPYNRVTPDSLALLSTILYYDLKDQTQYRQYIAQLATNYYPGISVVAQARSAYGGKFVDAPKAKKILLDESLKESSIFGRFYLGSSNFCQWDVIRTLGGAGFVVHDNGWLPKATLTADVMSQYGLVIMNGGSTEGDAMPVAAIEQIVSYVSSGGRLLIVCASKTLGRAQMPQYYNPLVSRFGFEFDEEYTTGGGTVKCTPADHPAVKGVDQFLATFGARVSGGTPLGLYQSVPLIAIANYGRGVVMAAGIGTGFQGNTIGDLYRVTDEQKAEAQVNRAFVLKLAQYLTSAVK